MISYIFWALGLLMLFFEFFLPGAIFAAIGILLLGLSAFFFISEATSIFSIATFLFFLLLSIFLVLKGAIYSIKRSKSSRSIYSDDSQEGFVASSFDLSAIGKRGTVLSDLKPGGYILIDGKRTQAISKSGYIASGCEVEVVSGQEETLIVKSVTTHSIED